MPDFQSTNCNVCADCERLLEDDSPRQAAEFTESAPEALALAGNQPYVKTVTEALALMH